MVIANMNEAKVNSTNMDTSESSIEEQMAIFLQVVEEYYRHFKLRKPVWRKITPPTLNYLVCRALMSVIDIEKPVSVGRDLRGADSGGRGDVPSGALRASQGLDDGAEACGGWTSLPTPDSTEDTYLSEEDLSQHLQKLAAEVSEAESTCKELYPRLRRLWQKAPAVLGRVFQPEIAARLCKEMTTLHETVLDQEAQALSYNRCSDISGTSSTAAPLESVESLSDKTELGYNVSGSAESAFPFEVYNTASHYDKEPCGSVTSGVPMADDSLGTLSPMQQASGTLGLSSAQALAAWLSMTEQEELQI